MILIVDTEAPQVTVWRRGTEGNWSYREQAGLDATIDLREIEAALPLAELYRDIDFEKA